MKRIFCAILSLCLTVGLLAGCTGGKQGSNQPSGNAPMGRYIEEPLGTLQQVGRILATFLDQDGNMVTYSTVTSDDDTMGVTIRRHVIPADDGEIRITNVDWLPQLGDVNYVAETEDGMVYALYYDENMHARIARSKDGLTVEDVKIPDLEGDGAISPPIEFGGVDAAPAGSVGFTSSTGVGASGAVEGMVMDVGGRVPLGMTVLPGGDLLLSYGPNGAARYSADGTRLLEFQGVAYPNSMAVFGNRLLMIGSDFNELWLYDLDKGEKLGAYTYDNLSFSTTVGLDKDGLYLTDSTGIYRQPENGSIWEKLVDGDLTSLSMPNLRPNTVLSDGSNGFLALLEEESSCQMMRYVYSADTPTTPDTELTIAGLRENSTIRQAIGEFQRKNPTVRVNFRPMMEDDSAATAQDMVRALNTQLLSGKGPDLLLLDGLPANAYLEKGVLVDITTLLHGLVEKQGLMPNLLSAYTRDGKIYGVPSRFSLPVMMGPAADVDAIKSLADLAGETVARQGDAIPFLRVPNGLRSDNGLVEEYAQAGAGQWMNRDGSLNTAALIAYFTQAARLDKTLKEHTPELDGSTAMTLTAAVSMGGMGEILSMGPSDLKSGRGQFHIQELSGPYGLQSIAYHLNQMEHQKLTSLFGEDTYYARGSVGIVSTGKQQELAAAFVEMLLSQTVQDKNLGDGYSVNQASLTASVEKALEGQSDMGFLALSKELSTPILVDQVVMDAVLAQAKELLAGTITPEQAADNVVQSTNIYLSE